MKERLLLIAASAAAGLISIILVQHGNPANMGFCTACFLRDIAGGLGLHREAALQYLRPEIMGLVLGSLGAAVCFRNYKSRGSSNAILRFFLGAFMMAGALIFLGCPLRMLLRLGGGDLNALIALPGYVFGIWIGTLFLRKGYTLGNTQGQPAVSGGAGPAFFIMLLIFVVASPAFIFFSTEGSGAMRAALPLALGAGLLIGFLFQRTKFCTVGAFRDLILFKNYQRLMGIAALFVIVLAGNLLLGNFNLGFAGQPVAHTQVVWSFLGMGIIGFAAVLAEGCPLRHLILVGEGNSDSMATVLGLVFGAAIMHNFKLAASPLGVPVAGQISVVIVWILLFVIAFSVTRTSNSN